MRLYDGTDSNANLLDKLTGYQLPVNVTSCGNEMHVVFSSDSSVTKEGYHAKIHVTEGSCSQGMQSKRPVFSIRHFPSLQLDFKEKIQEAERKIKQDTLRQSPASQIVPSVNILRSKISVTGDSMICPEYASIGNGICDEVNNNLVCLHDGGDCSLDEFKINCTTVECIEEKIFDPCPKYEKIGNGQCDAENFNIICSFDGGDCKAE